MLANFWETNNSCRGPNETRLLRNFVHFLSLFFAIFCFVRINLSTQHLPFLGSQNSFSVVWSLHQSPNQMLVFILFFLFIHWHCFCLHQNFFANTWNRLVKNYLFVFLILFTQIPNSSQNGGCHSQRESLYHPLSESITTAFVGSSTNLCKMEQYNHTDRLLDFMLSYLNSLQIHFIGSCFFLTLFF